MITRILTILLTAAALIGAGNLWAGGDVANGEELSIDCADCHGDDGLGDEDVPGIAGLEEAKHIQLLQDYKTGELADDDEDMLLYTEDLTDQDMADLAAY